MKKQIAIYVLLVISSSCNQVSDHHFKNNKNFQDFFTVRIVSGKNSPYLLYYADSMKNDSYYHEYCSAMWAFNEYLFSNYSCIPGNDSVIAKLIPDTTAVKEKFNALLTEDTGFRNIFEKAIEKKEVAPVKIDSLMKIASRFFLVHRSRGEIVQHLCSTINKVQSLHQNENSPYYNAFCFMAIWNNNNHIFDLFDQAVKPYFGELWGSKPISDDRLEEIKNDVFNYFATDKELRNILLKEYNEKKSYLNFKIIE